MNEQEDKAKAALAASPPPEPRAEAKSAALAAAMARFDEKNAEALQGSAAQERPMNRHWKGRWRPSLFGRRSMTTKLRSLRPVLLGGASLATLALAVVITQRAGVEPPPVDGDRASLAQEQAAQGQSLADGRTDAERQQTARLAEESRDNRPHEAPVTGAPALEREADAEEEGGEMALAAKKDAAPAKPRPPEAAAPEAVVEAEPMDETAMDETAMDETAMDRSAVDGLAAESDAVENFAADDLSVGGGGQLSGALLGRAVGGAAGLAEAKENRMRSLTRAAPTSAAGDMIQPGYQDQGRDQFEETTPNPVKRVTEDPVSTFSIDVDTASYGFMRKSLMNGVLPQKNAVRIEELVNYFPYDYPAPESRETPFRADVQILPTPWSEGTRLMRIGVRGYALDQAEKPRSNLVFLLDTSGSMNAPDKLPLLINSFRLLLDSLGPEDTVAIVTYAGSAGTVLEPTKASEKATILGALERLQAGGSTAGAEGVRQAYQLAEQSFDPDGVNRVILATDGDFNVGITDPEELKSFVERKRESGVMLSVLGFGRGNYNDAMMQTLAQNGNGQAAYIDTLNEARKTLVEEAASTLFPIAKDVKIQIEFNPAVVSEHRLIGYETRLLKREDFNNDRVDAGEIGSGHTVTALYEITPKGSEAELVDALRYQTAAASAGDGEAEDEPAAPADEIAFLKIRYKQPDASESRLIETPVTEAMAVDPAAPVAREARFAAAVAGFGQLLKGGRHTGDFDYDDVIALAESAKGPDPFGYRGEFVTLVRLAKSAAALERQR